MKLNKLKTFLLLVALYISVYSLNAKTNVKHFEGLTPLEIPPVATNIVKNTDELKRFNIIVEIFDEAFAINPNLMIQVLYNIINVDEKTKQLAPSVLLYFYDKYPVYSEVTFKILNNKCPEYRNQMLYITEKVFNKQVSKSMSLKSPMVGNISQKQSPINEEVVVFPKYSEIPQLLGGDEGFDIARYNQ
jgi:hypothetical protein